MQEKQKIIRKSSNKNKMKNCVNWKGLSKRIILLTFMVLFSWSVAYAQTVTADFPQENLSERLSRIMKNSNQSISFDVEQVKNIQVAAIKADKMPIEQLLRQSLNSTGFTYRKISGNNYIIVRAQQKPAVATSSPQSQAQPQPQRIRISGKVIDNGDKTTLPGVNILLKGTKNIMVTDINGMFNTTVERGSTLVFTYVGYEKKEVEIDGKTTNLVINMKTASASLQEVVVMARRKMNTESAVLQDRQQSSVVQDAISAALITKTASITTTQALQKVSGVTITDEKYVAVRGLGSRSVVGQLNGVRLASSDPDKSAIPLDLVPASLLDNITVYKTITPDKPADASAGIVELKTKSVPDKMTLEVLFQTGINTNIGIGGKYNSFWNNDMGTFGQKINDKNLSAEFKELSTQYPKGLSDIQQLISNSGYSFESQQEVNRINRIMQSFDPVMTTRYKQSPLNQLYSITFGNTYKLFGGKNSLGVIAGANYYKRTTDIVGGEVTQWSIYQGVVTGNPDIYSRRNIPNYITPNSLYMGKYQTYKENTGTETLTYGGLLGLTYQFNPRHEISMQYVGSWGGENQAINMSGAYEYTGLSGDVNSTIYSLKQTFRDLKTYNLQGEHKFLNSEYSPLLSYNLSTSQSGQNDPDSRYVSLVDYKPEGGYWYYSPIIAALNDQSEWQYSEHAYALTSGYVNGFGAYGTIQAEPNGRRWRNLEEDSYNHKADFSFPFRIFDKKQTFKTGFNYLYRERKFTENILYLPGSNFSSYGNIALINVQGNIDRMVSSDVVGIKVSDGNTGEGEFPVSGFLYNSKKSPNNYIGFYETSAFYGMLDLQLPADIRLTGGVRFEKTNIQSKVDTKDVYLDPSIASVDEEGNIVSVSFTNPVSVYKTNYKPYYSINLTKSVNKEMNFRFAYNTALARPELRELTNVFEFDPYQMGLIVGNPDLKNQHTQNLDFRWEWFPEIGEVFAISLFGKQIDDQLVKVFSLKTQGLAATYPEFPIIRFENDANTGRVWGIELEVVKDLGKLWGRDKELFIGSNLMLAESEIKKSAERLEANRFIDRHAPENSPLFEQAPYSINAYLNYNNSRSETDVTLSFNMVGERLVQINLTGEPDLYTQPEPTLDFVFSQQLAKRLILKGYAKNILNPDIKTVYANPKTGGKWYGKEYINRSYNRGSEIMIGLTYNLF